MSRSSTGWLAPLKIEPTARRSNLAQTVAQQLLGLIHEQGLDAGQKLPSEMELKDAFGVGRSTIREAINGLVALGVVEVRHGHGAFVRAAPEASLETVDAAIRRGVTGDFWRHAPRWKWRSLNTPQSVPRRTT